MTDRYDQPIKDVVATVWPGLDWRLIKAQMVQESSGNPNAKSACGALGLLQLMPDTFVEVLPGPNLQDITDPLINLLAGVCYLAQQFNKFPEIANEHERLKFALASYNGGRGYINRALSLARQENPAKVPTWEWARGFLAVEGCTVAGKHPDYRQIWHYVGSIMVRWAGYRTEVAA